MRACKHEVAAVLKKYNVAGHVILVDGEGMGEFGQYIDNETNDWSVIRFIKDGNAVHLKLYAKSNKENTNKTVNALFSLKDILAMLFQQTDAMINMIIKHFNVEVTGEGEFFSEDN